MEGDADKMREGGRERERKVENRVASDRGRDGGRE